MPPLFRNALLFYQAFCDPLPLQTKDVGCLNFAVASIPFCVYPKRHSSTQVAPGEHFGDDGSGTERRPSGRVVGIIKRNWRTRGYAGSLQPDEHGRPARSRGGSNVLFCPVERRFPFIRIHTSQVCFPQCHAALAAGQMA